MPAPILHSLKAVNQRNRLKHKLIKELKLQELMTGQPVMSGEVASLPFIDWPASRGIGKGWMILDDLSPVANYRPLISVLTSNSFEIEHTGRTGSIGRGGKTKWQRA